MISGKHAFWKTYHIDAKKLPKREGLKALPGRGTGIRKGNIAKIQEMAAGVLLFLLCFALIKQSGCL